MSNYSVNLKAMNEAIMKLKKLNADVNTIYKKALNKGANTGVSVGKQTAPVDTGFLRKSFARSPVRKKGKSYEVDVMNTADYASYVNDGHRQVNGDGETIGFKEGVHFMDTVEKKVGKKIESTMKSEIRKAIKAYDK